MQIRRTNELHPDLCVGNTLTQMVSRLKLILAKRIFSCFNIDRQEFAIILRPKLRLDALLKNRIAAASEFFFRVFALDS
jgi:hypothetical protein